MHKVCLKFPILGYFYAIFASYAELLKLSVLIFEYDQTYADKEVITVDVKFGFVVMETERSFKLKNVDSSKLAYIQHLWSNNSFNVALFTSVLPQ